MSALDAAGMLAYFSIVLSIVGLLGLLYLAWTEHQAGKRLLAESEVIDDALPRFFRHQPAPWPDRDTVAMERLPEEGDRRG